MKRKVTVSIALVLSIVLVSLIKSDSHVAAQNQIKIVADTGIIRIGPNQILRLTATPAGGNHNFRFRQLEYEPVTSEAGITTLAVSSQTASDLITLTPDEAVSVDVRRCIYPMCGGVYVRGVVLSNSRNVRVNASIIDAVTGEVVSFATTDLMIDVGGY